MTHQLENNLPNDNFDFDIEHINSWFRNKPRLIGNQMTLNKFYDIRNKFSSARLGTFKFIGKTDTIVTLRNINEDNYVLFNINNIYAYALPDDSIGENDNDNFDFDTEHVNSWFRNKLRLSSEQISLDKFYDIRNIFSGWRLGTFKLISKNKTTILLKDLDINLFVKFNINKIYAYENIDKQYENIYCASINNIDI